MHCFYRWRVGGAKSLVALFDCSSLLLPSWWIHLQQHLMQTPHVGVRRQGWLRRQLWRGRGHVWWVEIVTLKNFLWSRRCIFYRPLLFDLPRGNVSLSFHKSFDALINLFIVPLKDTSISRLCLLSSSEASLPPHEAVPLSKRSRVSAHGPGLQQSGRLRRQLGRRRVWWAQTAPARV